MTTDPVFAVGLVAPVGFGVDLLDVARSRYPSQVVNAGSGRDLDCAASCELLFSRPRCRCLR
jgi:hypothetical protein